MAKHPLPGTILGSQYFYPRFKNPRLFWSNQRGEKHGLESQFFSLSYCSISFISYVNLGKSLKLSEP